MQEEFKIITGFENYEVSNLGNVRNIETKRILKGGISKGYNLVGLTVGGKKISKLVHRLVAEAFLENPDVKQCVDHIDNNKLNNNLTNLRYATHTENNYNSSISSRNTSGTKGVCFESCSKTWHAYIRIDGIRINLGHYENKEDAIQARITRANTAFGEFVNSCEKV